MLTNEDHKNNIRQSFNRATHCYDQSSYPQQIIGNNLIKLLSKHLDSFDNIIDLGCGTGIVTEQLARCMHYKMFYAIDISDQLISHAVRRLSHHNINIFKDDFDHLDLSPVLFDLAFSNMALHWSLAFLPNLRKINESLAPDGLLAFTIPLDGTFTELDAASRNPFLYLAEVQQQMLASGFTLLACFSEQLTFAYSSNLKAIKAIRATGANYLFERPKKSLGLSLKLCPLQNKLSYNIGYFIGRKVRHVS